MTVKLNTPSLTEKAVSILALAIAVCALALTAYEGCATRRHNRLSVRPFLYTSFNYDKEGSGWYLYNKGVGPAFIRWGEVRFDGKPVRDWAELISGLGVRSYTHFEFSMPNGAYEANRTNRLLWLPIGPAESVVRAEHNRVVIRLCFCSIYDECWVRETNSDPTPVKDCGAIEAMRLAPPPLRPNPMSPAPQGDSP